MCLIANLNVRRLAIATHLISRFNSFPLQDENKRARKPGLEKNEQPLLLHPCKDQPLNFLEFSEEGEKRGLLGPRKNASHAAAARAQASIKTFALNRSKLVLERKRHFIDIQEQMQRVDEALVRVKEATDAVKKQREQATYDRELKRLLEFQTDDAPYVLMARQIIFTFLKSRGIGP